MIIFLSIHRAFLFMILICLFVFAENLFPTSSTTLYESYLNNEMYSDNELQNVQQHVRRKRYAIFPEGSTFTVAICVTLKLLTPDYDIFTEAVNWALTYDLPDSVSDYDKNLYGSSPPLQARRKRSAFFKKIETILDKNGLNGRACVLRSLCEVTKLLPDNDGFMEGIFKLLFRMPLQKVSHFEPEEHFDYDNAYRFGFDPRKSCEQIYSSCSVSILQILLNLQGR